MTNSNWDKKAIVKGMHRISNAERVKSYFKEPLEEIITPLLKGGRYSPTRVYRCHDGSDIH